MKRTFILFCVFAMGIGFYSLNLHAAERTLEDCLAELNKNCEGECSYKKDDSSKRRCQSECINEYKQNFCEKEQKKRNDLITYNQNEDQKALEYVNRDGFDNACKNVNEIDDKHLRLACQQLQYKNQAAGGALTSDPQKQQREAALTKAMAKNGEIYKCVDSTETAKEDCNLDRSDDMKGFFNFGKGMAMQGAAMTGAAQTAAQCNKFQQLSDLASTGLSGFKLYCATGVKSCSSACSDAKKFLTQNPQFQFRDDDKGYVDADDRIRKATKDCGKLTGSIAEAGMYIFTMVNNHAMAKQCQQILGKAENDMCKTHKELCDPNANYDCNNPQVALTNMVCKCRNNPNLADCNTGMGGLANNNNAIDPNSSADMSGFGNGAGGKILPGGGETPEQYGFPFEGKPGEGKANLSLGKGGAGHGGGGNGGAGGGGPAGAQKGAGGGTGLNAGILNGWNGGRGGAGGWGGAGGSGWADGKNGAAGNGNGRNPYMTVDKNGNPVDLRQFLPGQKLDATRGIAGISGPDGITGPNSSLWDKVRVRYNAQRNFVP